MKVAVIGIGTMGAGIARSLLRAGIEVIVWNRHTEKARPLEEDGATVAETSADAVRDADVVITILFDEEAVASVADDFLSAMKQDAVWMQAATVGPAGVRRLAEKAAAAGVTVVDTPMVGTKKPAEEGKLVVLASGAPGILDRLAPVFDAIGGKTVIVGDEVGNASALKLACNAWVASLTAATAQSIAICRRLGVDPALFLSAIDGGPTNAPYAQLKGGMMLESDFTPSFGVDGLVKDLGLMIESVQPVGMPTQLLGALHDLFVTAAESGHQSDDIAAVISAFDR
jgi:3-hydroxyisobutyrate dehydrogenase